MFRRLEIPTPFQVGDVNAYLVGRTLVDPGPDSQTAWATLVEALEAEGLSPDDVRQVLVTHSHPDHFGLAHRLRERGAEVVASPATADIVSDFPGRLEYEQSFFVDFFERHGTERKTAETVTNLPEAYLEYAPSVEVDRQVDDGDTLGVDGSTVTVHAAEGHAPGERLYSYETGDRTHAIVGDHVLAEITPNPLLQPPPTPDAERPRVLPAYNDSLERVAGLGFDLLRPGHREDIPDPAGRIEETLGAHERRTANVADLVDGPTTAAEVMEGLFGDLPATEVFPGMSEAVGHLDVLELRDEVTRDEEGGPVVYRPT